MSLKQLITTMILTLLLATMQVVAQSCETYCSNYDQALVNCQDSYSSGVDGSGTISTGAVDCMCIGTESFTGFYEMSMCYKCNILTGANYNVNYDWVITCATNQQSGIQAAAQCWNQELLNNNLGEPCFQGSAQPSASGAAATSSINNAVVSSSVISFASAATSSALTLTSATQSTTLPAATTAAPNKSSADHIYISHVALLIGILFLSMTV